MTGATTRAALSSGSSARAGVRLRTGSTGGRKKPSGTRVESQSPAKNSNESTPFKKAGATYSAAGERVEIPDISGDGVPEIRAMRGPMIRANIAKALEGNYLHMKALFEYAGVWPAEAPSEEEDASLASLLLEKLETGTEAELPPVVNKLGIVSALRASSGARK